jgi:hypothetical protein
MIQIITKILRVHPRWRLAFKTLPSVLIIILLKAAAHHFGYEFLTLNALFTAIISANIFLIGFLISGTLVDYKESEKLPGDLSASIEAMADEGFIMYKHKKSREAKKYLQKLALFNKSMLDWFYKRVSTDNLMKKLLSFNDDFYDFETQTHANFVGRLKQEQNAIRKIIKRIDVIRETSFVGTGYAVTEIITLVLITCMIFINMDPFYEGMLFISFVSFILIYMIFFIKDLDNPFGFNEKNSWVEEVSLKPLEDSMKRLDEYCAEIK